MNTHFRKVTITRFFGTLQEISFFTSRVVDSDYAISANDWVNFIFETSAVKNLVIAADILPTELVSMLNRRVLSDPGRGVCAHLNTWNKNFFVKVELTHITEEEKSLLRNFNSWDGTLSTLAHYPDKIWERETRYPFNQDWQKYALHIHETQRRASATAPLFYSCQVIK